MRHVEKALNKMQSENKNFISIENIEDEKGVPPVVKFKIQSDPIGEVGVNGCQASDMLEFVKCLFESLNDSFPCEENKATINSLESAISSQEERTKDREARGVEGKNEA
jgi:hypothetical protein